MSNGTKKLGKDFQKPQGPPESRSVTVTINEKGLGVGYKNANWQMAVDLLVDGLQIARVKETQQRIEKEKERIAIGDPSQIPGLRAGTSPLKES